MENAGQIRWITGYEPQRAFVIESLETIEQLPGDFQVRLHSQPHEYQLAHFFWRANRERCRSDPGEGKIRLDGCTLCGARPSLPNGQTVDRTPFEVLVLRDGTNPLGEAAAALNEVEPFSRAGFVRRQRATDACCIARWVQPRNGSRVPDQSRPEFGLRIAPALCEVCAFELI